MAERDKRETFAATLRDLPPAAHTSSEETDPFDPFDPDGRPMAQPQRMPLKQVRSWLRREHVPLGIWSCGSPIAWVPAAERAAFAKQLRRAEDKDCDTNGDALLFTLAQDRHAVVLDRRLG